MKLTRIVFLAAAVMIPATWTMATAGETAAPAGEKTDKSAKAAPAGDKAEKSTKSKKEGSSDSTKAGESTEKKAEKK